MPVPGVRCSAEMEGTEVKHRCAMCGDEAEQLILYDGFLFCGRECIRAYDRAEPERRMLVHFYDGDVRYVGEDGIDVDFALIDGTSPQTPQAGETWEITMRRVCGDVK